MKAMEQQEDRMDKIATLDDKPKDVRLARCLEPQPRSNSLDQLTSQAIAKILSIFKSSSSSDAGASAPGTLARSSSPTRGGARSSARLSKSRSAESSVGGSQPPRRRFMRVVRDENAPPPGALDDNPHIIPHYSQKFLVAHYNQKSAEEDLSVDRAGASQPRVLPYVTSGHTILKKSSGDQIFLGAGDMQAEASPAATQKHASFFAEVEVIEYNLADKVVSPNHCSHILPLRDSDDDDDMMLEANVTSACEDETRNSIGGAAKSVSFFTSHDACDATADEMRSANQSNESTEDSKMAVVGEAETCQVDATKTETVNIVKTEAADREAAKTEAAKSEAANAEGIMRNIFSAIVTLDSAGMQVSKAQEPPTKHIRLADLINAPKSSGAKS